MLENQVDAGVIDSASIGTEVAEIPESVEIAQTDEPTDVETIEETAVEETEGTEDTEAEAEAEQVVAEAEAKAKETDTPLVSHLRQVAKSQAKELAQLRRAQSENIPTEPNSEAAELHSELFKFDIENGVPTTKGFAEKVFSQAPDVAEQAAWDLMSQTDEQGMAIGHKILQKMGLDPYKLEELRQFSRGELKGADYGIIEVPKSVPAEYAETFKKLPTAQRETVDFWLESGDEEDRRSALQTLDNAKFRIETEADQKEAQAQAQNAFNQDITQTSETKVLEQYSNILESIAKSAAYQNVIVSSNNVVDKALKDSIITDINALGDPNSVLSARAFNKIESMGVKVDKGKIEVLMAEIETATREAVTAEKYAKNSGRDYTPQIKASLSRQAEAVRQITAYGNKVFSEILAKMVNKPTPAPEGAMPTVKGEVRDTTEGDGSQVKSLAELNKMYERTRKGIAAQT